MPSKHYSPHIKHKIKWQIKKSCSRFQWRSRYIIHSNEVDPGWLGCLCSCANTGGFSAEQLKTNEENAYKLGAKAYVTLGVTHEYYEKSLKYMIFGNVLRNNCYPISVSSERIFQAIAIARYAKEIGADAIAHGSTGAGNDQIPFRHDLPGNGSWCRDHHIDS